MNPKIHSKWNSMKAKIFKHTFKIYFNKFRLIEKLQR